MLRRIPGPLTIVSLVALAACATGSAPQMGAQPDPVAPRLVASGQTDPRTGAALYQWDRPSAFGATSGERKASGDAACMAARVDLEAIGYHPAAIDEKGQPLPGGGYYCSPKATGESPAATPPALVYGSQTDAAGGKLPAWDHPAAFGKIPANLQAKGDAACMRSSPSLQAIAYHPAALGIDGKPLPGGGFFCYDKKTGDRPTDPAPRLVQVDGITGWDRPAAFGAVPPGLQPQGDAVCTRANASLRAIGYHPAALDQQGRPIPGGGYFCTPRTTARA